MRETT